jgi:ABC-type multidrug transport system permease subunit
MSTADPPELAVSQNRIIHSTAVGAIVSGIVFLGCWLLALAPLTGTHALIALFTASPATSSEALVQGLCWSLVFGAWVGFLIAAVSRLVRGIAGRG